KPFNPRELLARIRAISRRQSQIQTDKAAAVNKTQCFGSFCIDFASHTLSKDKSPISLTNTEYELLKILIKHPNRVLSRDALITELQGYERSPYDRSIDVCISRIRRKIGDNSSPQNLIETVRSVGYRFNVPDDKQDAMD
ncbi:MAG: two-component system response regulator OmpR, partial [Gammaproteobacteria bacterium]